ncbi:MAG: plastocyanin/azurin family copper-binding protein [Tahibacter sp.]
MTRIQMAAALLAALAAGGASAANVDVTAGSDGNFFFPSVFTISVGDTVTFQSVNGFHNVLSGAGSVTTFRCANGCDGVGNGNGDPAAAGWTAVVTFTTVGSVPFLCEVHGQSMSGTITVVPVPVRLQSFDID